MVKMHGKRCRRRRRGRPFRGRIVATVGGEPTARAPANRRLGAHGATDPPACDCGWPYRSGWPETAPCAVRQGSCRGRGSDRHPFCLSCAKATVGCRMPILRMVFFAEELTLPAIHHHSAPEASVRVDSQLIAPRLGINRQSSRGGLIQGRK